MVAETFTKIYQDRMWGDECPSGLGSTPKYTVHVKAGLGRIIDRFKPKSFLDIPCGDGEWIKDIRDCDQFEYIGADIVEDIIHVNRMKWPTLPWRVLDICTSPLPRVDLVFSRDCLVHLPLEMVHQAIFNLRQSRSRYLAMTTFPDIPEGNGDIPVGSWRRLDFTAAPFYLSQPIMLVNECGEFPSRSQDKSIGVWDLHA